MNNQEVDEILEMIWVEKEQGKNEICLVKPEIEQQKYQSLLKEMRQDGLIIEQGSKNIFTAKGEKAASQLIRRHRLAERLLVDILDTRADKVEEPACQFEHLVSEEVTEAICTLLGHPTICPHGLPIPAGKCCLAAQKQLESLITSLDKIEVGEWATVAYILSHHHPRLHKLMSFGIAPGVKIKLHQKSPTYVIQVEETQIALEAEIVKDIFIRKG